MYFQKERNLNLEVPELVHFTEFITNYLQNNTVTIFILNIFQ